MTKRTKKESGTEIISYITIIKLCILAIAVEVAVILITKDILNSFVDTWGFKVYLETILVPYVLQGKLPYIDYFWEYPIIMVAAVFLAAIPSILVDSPILFFYGFPILMSICHLVILVLVYLITKKVYRNEKMAIAAGVLYATAFVASYITLTNFDPLPVMFVMIGLACTIYGNDRFKSAGYLAYILGFFTKIYPVAILPFLVLFNAKKTSLYQEIITVIKVGIIPFLILFVPIYILNPSMIDTYLIKNAAGKGVFADSFVYAMYSWVYSVFGVGVPISMVSTVMSIVLVLVIGFLLYASYKKPLQNPVFLLQVTLIALVAIISCSAYHSPQYMLWIMPLLCILAAGDLLKVVLFYLLQIIWFIKFPLLFKVAYTNGEYLNPLPSALGYLTLVFFTIEYLVLFYLVWISAGKEVIKNYGC